MRSSIFISYSHHDEGWRKTFERALNLGTYKADILVWSDKRISVGDKWEKEIKDAILKSRVALLLVSNNFVKSDFIQRKELKDLIESQRIRGLTIFWVPITDLDEFELNILGLGELEAASDPNRPLSRFRGRAREKAIHQICLKLIDALGGLIVDTGRDVADRFMQATKDLLWQADFAIKKPIATGDFSVIFDAERQRDQRRVVIKTIVTSHRREWLSKNFLERARLVQDLHHHSLIRIVEIVPSDPLSAQECACVVSDYVTALSLESVRNERPNRRLDPREVAYILYRLAEGCAELHGVAKPGEKGLLMGPLRPSNVFYDEAARRVQVSTVRISHETMPTCEFRPSLLLEDEALTYLTPERYEGAVPDDASDQYHLALLGLELLTGRPPVEAKSFSDLKRKEEFFERPYEFFDELRTSNPALSFVLARMLERDPGHRWPNMHDASVALMRISEGRFPDELRATAKNLYQECILNNKSEFYPSFYKLLFEYSPRARELFSRVDLESQYQKLDEAMGLLLNFRAEQDPTTLFHHAKRHSDHKLQSSDFEAFQKAFLNTLDQLFGKEEPYTTDAWRAILAAGVSYMADRAAVRAEYP